MKILVVDDELVSRKKMQVIMENFGECMAVESGPMGLDAFADAISKGKPYDLVTLDVAMPDMDGTEVLFFIRELEKEHGIRRKKGVKAIMVTALADKNTVITSIQAGCDAYVVKPFDKYTILEKMKQLQLLNA
ncbi:two-component system, chemotaxis family, response regulator CheY [Desulfonatronum thiosulfatophilum]|uniref:Two-component system, chemotaxis family, response regulator CheY n=1 Tax=Desulfonatronum thiosulfatophilum TaxID=617002 RepID=A0A1G6A3S0_9BACT|nr:response regulator [Desulfonatronum thiosulfatophilum]SDB03074.1 two-component system, chemotaxis family, response regulator CheY [Desulfonatronum thiosulfatophilum]